MVGFGISVGDFIAGINTLIDIVHSLSDTNGAQADYKELGSELQSLKSGLDGIEALSLEATQTTEFSALNAAVKNCRACVERFLQRNRKFKSLENTPVDKWSLATLKKCGRGVQWAIWTQGDVERFRGQIQVHTLAIGMLLSTLQIKQNNAHKAITNSTGAKQGALKRRLSNQRDNTKRIRLNTMRIRDSQASLAQSISSQHTEMRDHLRSQARDLESAFASQSSTTSQIGVDVQYTKNQTQAVLALQQSLVGGSTPFQERLLHFLLEGATKSDNMIMYLQQLMENVRSIYAAVKADKEIPPELPLSKAVILHDARGREFRFYLDFIDSAEAFLAVLKVRFKDIGLRKIENGQFVLEDTRRKNVISLKSSWLTVVRPGQHISMSMIFRQQQTARGRCPSCGESNEESEVEEVDCVCGMTYRRIVEGLGQTVSESSSAAEADPLPSGDLADRAPASCAKSSRDDSMDEEMHHYTRVQILAQLPLLSDERQRTADTSDDCSDDEMSAAVIDLDDMPPTIDLKPKDAGKSAMLKTSPMINEDTASVELSDMPVIDLKPTDLDNVRTLKVSVKINEDKFSEESEDELQRSVRVDLNPRLLVAGEAISIGEEAHINADWEQWLREAAWNSASMPAALSTEPLNMPTTDLKPTDVRESEMSKASANINKDTSFAEPLDMSTKFPVPQASGGGGPPSRGKLGEGHKYWTCHQCHHINPLALSERCIQCQHYRCVYCRFG